MSWTYEIAAVEDYTYVVSAYNPWTYVVAEGTPAPGTSGDKQIVTKASRKYITTKDGRTIKTR